MIWGDLGSRRRPRFSKEDKKYLFDLQKGRCKYCGIKLPISYFEIDHKTPVARRGGDNWGNLQILCGPCNRRKGDLTDGEFRRVFGLPGSRDPLAKAPPKRKIPQSYFEKISKQIASENRAARRQERDNWGMW